MDYATGLLVENINSATISGKGSNKLTFNNSVQLKNGIRYYIEFADSTFLDYSDNPCDGIPDKEKWNFMVDVTSAEYIGTQSADLTLFPNPANDQIIIQNFPAGTAPSNVEILDMTGRKVDSFILPANQIRYEYNCQTLRSGIYFVRISSPSGFLIKKLVKE